MDVFSSRNTNIMLQNRSGVLLNKKLTGQALLRSPRRNQHTASEASGVETIVFFNQTSFAFFTWSITALYSVARLGHFVGSFFFYPSLLFQPSSHCLQWTVLPMSHSTAQSCNCSTLSPALALLPSFSSLTILG